MRTRAADAHGVLPRSLPRRFHRAALAKVPSVACAHVLRRLRVPVLRMADVRLRRGTYCAGRSEPVATSKARRLARAVVPVENVGRAAGAGALAARGTRHALNALNAPHALRMRTCSIRLQTQPQRRH